MTEPIPEPLHHRTFTNRTLRASRFVSCDFGDVVVRGSDLAGMELDSPWLLEGGNTLLVNLASRQSTRSGWRRSGLPTLM